MQTETDKQLEAAAQAAAAAREDGNAQEFEQRAGALLRESADNVDGATRSRLTQARHRALDQRAAPRAFAAWRRWAPTGAVALAVLLTLGYVSRVGLSGLDGRGDSGASSTAELHELAPAGAVPAENSGEFDDLALLADSEALELSQDDDLDFYEWAAGNGAGGEGTQAVGT